MFPDVPACSRLRECNNRCKYLAVRLLLETFEMLEKNERFERNAGSRRIDRLATRRLPRGRAHARSADLVGDAGGERFIALRVHLRYVRARVAE
jgi:hypothetical protein